jgi:aminoglycoside phosphotransferase
MTGEYNPYEPLPVKYYHESLDRIKEVINEKYSDLKITKIVSIGDGFNSFAYRINDDWIFSFPKRHDVAKALKATCCLLPKIEMRINMPIVHFEYVGDDYSFVGYREIKGVQFTKELFLKCSHDFQRNFAEDIASFLKCFHTFPIFEAKRCGIDVVDFRKEFSNLQRRANTEFLPLLDKETQAIINHLFEKYLKDEDNFEYKPALLHGDLGHDNIIYDKQRNKIAGVIDFTSMGISDPDFDLRYLLTDYGEDFGKLLAQQYGHPDPTKLFKKNSFFNFFENVFTTTGGLSIKDDKIIQTGLFYLSKQLNRQIEIRHDKLPKWMKKR